MAKTGLIKPYFAKYNYNSETGVVTYSGGGVLGHAIEYTISCEKSEDNKLWADNKVVEIDRGRFQSGTFSLGTDHLSREVSKTILGIKEVTYTKGTLTVKELVYDDDMEPVALGIGVVETHQVNNQHKYRAVITPKVIFSPPEDSATTKGETIEWQTPSIEGKIERSDEISTNYKQPWKKEAWFDDGTQAEEYIRAALNISASTAEQEGDNGKTN